MEISVEGLKYTIYPDGKIYSHSCKRYLKPKDNGTGYFQVEIAYRPTYVHRLVATCHIPNPLNYSEVNHKDFNKSNNHIDNLEWCTRAQNFAHYKYAKLKQKPLIQTQMKLRPPIKPPKPKAPPKIWVSIIPPRKSN